MRRDGAFSAIATRSPAEELVELELLHVSPSVPGSRLDLQAQILLAEIYSKLLSAELTGVACRESYRKQITGTV